MALNIRKEGVISVLLADGWHDVAEDSFDIGVFLIVAGAGEDSYAIHDSDAAGFEFREPAGPRRGVLVSGPLSSLIALRWRDS